MKKLFPLMLVMLAVMMPMKLWAQEPYAVLTTDTTSVLSSDSTGVTYGKTLTFYYDDQKVERNGMSVGPFYIGDYQAWHSSAGSITKAVFDASFASCTTLTSTAWWFHECSILTSIVGMENLNTENVTNMESMFSGCSGLTNLDVSNFKTDNVTNMGSMFEGCSGLTNLDVSNFKTDNVTDMSWMFLGCSGLTTLDVSNFKTDNVTDMSSMFWGCSSLTSLDVSNFNTENVTNMSWMFEGCSSLTNLDVSNFKTDNVTDMSAMFSDCSGLTNLDVSNFKTDNVTNMESMFSGCSGLTNLNLSNFNTDNVTSMNRMFSGCSGLTSLNLSSFNTGNVKDMESMFSDCSGLTNLDVSNFNTANVTDMSYMFLDCSGLTTIYAGSGWSTAAVTSGEEMFTGCTKLVGGAGTPYDANHTDHAYAHIDGGESNPGYFTEKNASVSQVATPTFTRNNNIMSIATTTENATIYYTLDGSTPNRQSTQYASPLEITQNCTVKAIAVAEGYEDSEVATYVVDWFNATEETFYLSFDGMTAGNKLEYANGFTLQITGNEEKSISNGRNVNINGTSYQSMKVSNGAQNTLTLPAGKVAKAITFYSYVNTSEATERDCYWKEVAGVTYESPEAAGGLFASYLDTENLDKRTYDFGTGRLNSITFTNTGIQCCYVIEIAITSGEVVPIFPSCSKPVFAHENGTNIVTITTTTQNATIYYTTDGSTPTKSSTLYTDSITITQNCTVKAIAVAEGYEDSEVAIYNVDWFSEEGLDTLEIYAVETGSTITPNQPIMATQSVIVTPGNDVEWPTNMSMGSAWVNPLDFTSNIYYPGSTTTYTFEGSMRGTNNPKDGDLEDGVSTGNGYKPYQKNYPKSGGFLTFEVQQEGSLIIPIRVFAGKPLYVTDKTGTAKKDIQFKDASGQTLALQTNPLCAVSADEDVTGFVSFNVQPGEKYYVFSVGSKARFGGYVFSKQAIDIDPATMANVIDSLDALPITLEPYAVLTTDTTSVLSSDSTGVTYGKTLTFYYDNQKEARNGMSVGPFESSSERGWNSNADSITVVVFDDSFANCTTLTSTALWFSGCRNLKTIVGIENLKTDHVTTMFAMFDCCNSLTSLDVSKFNTENVTRMNDMFSDCRSLTSLDVTNFNTAKVTDMCDMFINCSSLTSLDVSNFKTDSVTNLSFMFIECSGLTSLDLSNFNTAKVTDMSKMFALCSGLKTIYVGEEWSTASVTNGTDMFKGCSAIKGGKGTTYSEISTIAYGNSTSSDYARIDYKGMPGYFTPKYGYTPEPTYTLEGNVLTIKAPIESSVYYVITDLYSGVDFESGDSLRIPETLYTGPLTLDHPVRVRFMAVNGRIAHSEIIVVKYKPIEATFDGRVLAVGGSTTMTDALESVGGRDEVAKTITAIVWNSSVALTNSDLLGLDNPNLLIYVNERSQAPQNRNNVVVNGLAMNVVLSDTGSGNCDFYAPQTFTAEMITYSREFKQATQVGVCRGWETISLPFMVQTIAHADKGVITPFGVDTSNKHFWLRQLSTNGLVSATKIEANLPYLISMPNDEKNYAKEYILKGLVTFSAENAVVPKTEPTALALADSSVVMVPALQSVGKSSTVWALNVGMERSQYFEGSTFERDYREVRPFEAYTVHRSDTPAPRFLPINDLMNSATGIETISNVIMSHDNYYHIDGRKVDGKPTKKGLYITNGRKVVVK